MELTVTVRTTPTFDRTTKKLHARDKKTVDDAIRAIIKTPTIGDGKKGDLAGIFVNKLKLNKFEILLSYQFNSSEIILLSLGSHENFYRNLKR